MIRKHNFCGKKVFSVKRRRGRKTRLMLFLWNYKVQINCLPCAVLGSKLLDLELKVLLDRVELAIDFLDSEIFLCVAGRIMLLEVLRSASSCSHVPHKI